MGYHTGNVYCNVLRNALVLLYLIKIQIKAQKKCSTIRFHVYPHVSHCNIHGICPYEELTICSLCYTDLSSAIPGKVYTQKELVLLETLISELHNKYYNPAIKNWDSICHMCVLLECITVSNNAESHLTVGENNMMFYAGVIM